MHEKVILRNCSLLPKHLDYTQKARCWRSATSQNHNTTARSLAHPGSTSRGFLKTWWNIVLDLHQRNLLWWQSTQRFTIGLTVANAWLWSTHSYKEQSSHAHKHTPRFRNIKERGTEWRKVPETEECRDTLLTMAQPQRSPSRRSCSCTEHVQDESHQA